MKIITRRQSLVLAGGAALTLAAPAIVRAQGGTVHEIEMLNRHPDTNENMAFSPDIMRGEVGDTFLFLATDRGHNCQSNRDMIPDGGTEWRGRINEEVEVTIDVPGAYGYLCQPHLALGMVGLLLVGDVSGNYEALKGVRQRGRATAARYEDIFARADALLAAEG